MLVWRPHVDGCGHRIFADRSGTFQGAMARQHIPGGANVNVSLAGRDLIVGVSLGEPPVTIDPGSRMCLLLSAFRLPASSSDWKQTGKVSHSPGHWWCNPTICPRQVSNTRLPVHEFSIDSTRRARAVPAACPRRQRLRGLGWTRSPANCAQSASGPPRPQVPHKAATVVWSTATRFGVQQAVT
jgi:hypothetical protein